MAKNARRMPIARRKKNYTKTKREKDIDREAYRIALGDEPSDAAIETYAVDKLAYATGLDWYRQACDAKDARAFLEDFLEEIGNQHLDAIQQVPDVWLNLTACFMARLMSRGAKLPPTSVPLFKRLLKEMVAKAGTKIFDPNAEEEEERTQRVPIQTNIRQKASDLIAEIEGLIDDGKTTGWSAYEWLVGQSVSSVVASRIANRFEPLLAELIDVSNKTDEQLIEGYRHLKKGQLQTLIEFYQGLISDANRFAANTKKKKGPRKKKPQSVERKLKLFNCQKESVEYKIASIDPAKILRANELWTFNTSTKVLQVYRTTAGDILDINRTAITKFEPRMSIAKRIGRDTEDVLKGVLTGSKGYLNKLMDTISAKPTTFRERISDCVVLLRVV